MKSWNPDSIKKIHMVAVCGVGMGSLAGMFREAGYRITGSDQDVYPPMSDQLAKMGIEVSRGYRAENVPDDADLVVIGNAISRDNPEAREVLSRGIPYTSFPDALYSFFIRGRRSVVVSGTHGKTTTASLIAWILESAGRSPSFMIGGVPVDFGVNYRLGSGEVFVSEGDEYDSAFFDKGPKFLHYRPEILVLGNVEFDHADIYRDLDHVLSAFGRLLDTMESDGLIVAGMEDERVRSLVADAKTPVQGFGIDSGFEWNCGGNVTISENRMIVDVRRGKDLQATVQCGQVGLYNARNILAAFAACRHLGLSAEEIGEAASAFKGVMRRQERVGQAQGVLIFHDFAHHPTAVSAALRSFRQRYPEQRIWAVFEPRTATSRRKVFQARYADAFVDADRLILAPVFKPEKIPEGEVLDTRALVRDLNDRGLNAMYCRSFEGILDHLVQSLEPKDVVVFMSNGAFGGLPGRLLGELSKKKAGS